MKKIKLLISIVLFCLFVGRVGAVPALPYPATITQPDGTTLTVLLKGDEFHHYHTTSDGYLIARSNDGFFHYATANNDGDLQVTGMKAKDSGARTPEEKEFLGKLSDDSSFSLKSMQIRRAKAAEQNRSISISKFPKQGSPRSLVILVEFSDLEFAVDNPQTSFSNMLNEERYSTNGGTGSARDYFIDNSGGVFAPQFDVVGPYTLPNKYSYYGENDPYNSNQDKNPVQMIVDACTAAHNDGVDFTIYDTENNDEIDNIFVFYAGYNEAEHGPSNTIWPHRWAVQPEYNYFGTIASITFDGKLLYGYACTSELKWDSEENMTGIGTFTHEFGHVLGLPDFYDTSYSGHHTLSDWSIMDAGNYLNEGRTPPAYSAYERFFLGFLTPELLNEYPQDITLESMTTSNKAYIITHTGTHNLNPEDPAPDEFFILENRQKTGWDAYLPGHGMLIYRINYNYYDWKNGVNNDPDNMGIDILEADEIANDATLSGDPFPGTNEKRMYDLISRSGTSLDKRIKNITESEEGVITFSIHQMYNTDSYKLDDSKPVTFLNETFETTQTGVLPDGWKSVSAQGSRNWDIQNEANNKYVQMTARGGDGTYKTLLISPAVDFDGIEKPIFHFDWKSGFTNGATLKVHIMSKDGTTTELKTINDKAAPNNYRLTFVTDTLDISDIEGVNFIVFEYNGMVDNKATTVYQVDNVTVETDLPSGLSGTDQDNNVYVSDGKIHFCASAGEVIEVYNMMGQRLHNSLATDGQNSVSVDIKGVAIVKVGSRVSKVILR